MHASELLTTNANSYWTRLESSTRGFEPGPSLAECVTIVDVPTISNSQSNIAVPLRQQDCADLKSLEDHLDNPANASYSCRFISICQKDSWSRLQITKPMLKKLIEHHEVDANFLEVPLSFSYRTTDEEQSFCVPWTVNETEFSIQLFYTFRYGEFKGHPNEPWVIRQVGVYQKIDIRQKTSLFILVNAVPDSEAHRRVMQSFASHQVQMQTSPLWIHEVVQASYFMRWREYIAEYEKRLLPIADTTTSTMINRPLRVSHDTLGRVRFLESRFLPLRSILSSFEEVAEGLGEIGSILVAKRWVIRSTQLRTKSRLENSKRYARAFVRSALFMQERSNNTATLLADTLAFRNQGVAQEQNGSMVVLTRSAVFITVITLIYLPWTLITGIFGMEFFELDQETGSLITSPQIWIYFVAAVGTTLFTVLLYFAMAGFPSIRRRDTSVVKQAQDDHVPQSLQRGYTDLEKNPIQCG